MIAFLVGVILGIFYFGGLYLSVKKIDKVKYPSLLMTVSFIIRMSLLILGFFYISKGDYRNILLALAGVILIRFIMTFTVKSKISNS